MRLSIAIIGLGACSIISQIILIRELQVTFQGNELSLGLILFCWLLGSAIGAALSCVISRRLTPKNLLSACFIISAWLGFFNLALIRGAKIIFGISIAEIIRPFEILLITSLAVIPAAIFTGAAFILSCYVINNSVKAYSLEALGDFIAGVLSAFLIGRLNSSRIIWIVSALYTCIGLILLRFSRKFIYLFIALAAVLMAALFSLDKFEYFTQSLRFWPQKLIASADSVYANISVCRVDGLYSLYENGKLTFSTEDTAATEEFAHIILLSHPDPKRVLLIGSGFSGIIAEIDKHKVELIDYIEPDKLLLDTAVNHIPGIRQNTLDSGSLRVHNLDIRAFMKKTKEKYDIIILNQADPATLGINRFYTVEFFSAVKTMLNSSGIFCAAISSKEDILKAQMLKYNASVYKSAGLAFTNVEIIPGERIIFLCSDSPSFKISSRLLEQRYKTRAISAKFFAVEYLKMKFLRQEYIKREILKVRDEVFANRDYAPHGFFYYLGIWGKQSWLNFARIQDILNRIKLTHWIILTFLAVYFLRRNILKTAIFSSGLSGISLEFIISLIFQIKFGFLYYRIGLIIACFMLGLSLGSLFIYKIQRRILYPYRLLYYLEIMLAVLPLSLVFFLKYNQAAFFMFSLLSGLAIGMEGAVFYSRNKPRGVYALDLSGACLGSLAVGILLIPTLGIFKTCVLLAFLKLSTAFFLRRLPR